jgi:hypothetical protein
MGETDFQGSAHEATKKPLARLKPDYRACHYHITRASKFNKIALGVFPPQCGEKIAVSFFIFTTRLFTASALHAPAQHLHNLCTALTCTASALHAPDDFMPDTSKEAACSEDVPFKVSLKQLH